MESFKEKPLLYYVSYRRMPRHFGGLPVNHFLFKDVKTGEEVTLGACFYNEELSNRIGWHYYQNIEDAVIDFDILWKLVGEKIKVVDGTFEEAQQEYQRMVSERISPEEINTGMMKFYGVKSITRKL